METPITNPRKRIVKYTGNSRTVLRNTIVPMRDEYHLTFVEIGRRLDITPSLARTIYNEKLTTLSIIDRIKLWFNFGIGA